MNTAEILAAFPQAPRCWWSATSAWTAGAATIPRSPSRRAKPAFRASPWWRPKSRRARPAPSPIIWRALGAGGVDVLGLVGDDGFGYELARALAARGISTDLLVEQLGVPTFTYTKLINRRTGEEDLPRVDFVNTAPLPAECRARTDRAVRARCAVGTM